MSRLRVNHNLYRNLHVFWFVGTRYPTPQTKEKVRVNLETKDAAIARQRRDALFAADPLLLQPAPKRAPSYATPKPPRNSFLRRLRFLVSAYAPTT